MNYQIKQTKIILPRRQKDMLTRHRLLSMLDDLLDHRLTFISAPAGYGKTSLLVDLADKVEYPVCWLAIDPLDNDPARFISYFVAAISQQFPDFGTSSRSLISNLEGIDLDQEQILRTIINDLYDHVREHFALVLDDFHLVDKSPEINYFINQFIQETDENCHIVIASRSLLSLPDLPLMIGRSQVKGLSFEELAFLPDEIKDLYQIKYSQVISDSEMDRIMAESEGWITGLLLTAETAHQELTEQGRAARAAGIDVYDYLARQVLEQQSPEMQDFLLKTSLLEEFNADLCQETLGDPVGDSSWGDLILQLLQKNLFVQPFDSEGTWLRYHQLFREFLRLQYQKNYPDQTKELLLKLVEVYRSHEWFEYAYTACRLLDDDQVTADYLESISSQLLHRGQISLLKSWLDDLSAGLLEEHLGLLVYQVTIASLTGDAEFGLQMVNRALEGQSDIEDPGVLALLYIRRATCHRLLGRFQSGWDDALQALNIIKDDPKEKILEAEAEREMGLNLQPLGQSSNAKVHLERSLSCYLDLGDQKNVAVVQIGLGFLEMNEGGYTAARNLFQQAFQFWEKMGNLNRLVGLSNNLGVLDHLVGDYLESFGWFSKALAYARQSSNLRESAFTLASLSDLAIDMGALPKAEEYIIESYGIAEEIGDSYLQIYLQLSMAALARIRGDLGTAREHLAVVEFRIRDFPAGAEKGMYHLENGYILKEENLLEQALSEFQISLEVFENSSLPVEICQSLIALAWIDCLRGDLSQTDDRLDTVQEMIQSLGTIQPLVPTFARQEELLTCLEDHRREDPFTGDLVRAVSAFRSRLPILLEKLQFNIMHTHGLQRPLLEIHSMGRVSVKHRGEILSVPEWTKQKTVRELFFYLLSYPEGASREEICLEFWPDSKPEQLKKQFKNALYRLRRAVGKDTILYHKPTRLYHFNRKLDYTYDVEEFYELLDLGDAETDPDRKVDILSEAAALYQHPFAPALEGIWSEPVRYRLYLDYERIMLIIAERQFLRGKLESSLQTIEKLLKVIPGQEKAWRLAMRSYALNGDRAGIERTFQRCRQALAQDLDAEPSQETLSLYQELMS